MNVVLVDPKFTSLWNEPLQNISKYVLLQHNDHRTQKSICDLHENCKECIIRFVMLCMNCDNKVIESLTEIDHLNNQFYQDDEIIFIFILQNRSKQNAETTFMFIEDKSNQDADATYQLIHVLTNQDAQNLCFL